MYKTTVSEFREIMLTEVETRWPRWKYSAADENDFYAACKNCTPAEIVLAIQTLRVNESPSRPTIAGLRKYLPKPKPATACYKPAMTPEQYKVGYMSAKVVAAYDAILRGDKSTVEFIRDMDAEAVRMAEQYVRENRSPEPAKPMPETKPYDGVMDSF